MNNIFDGRLIPSDNIIIPEKDENLIRLYMQNNVGTFTIHTYRGESFEFFFAKNDAAPMISEEGGGGDEPVLALSPTRSNSPTRSSSDSANTPTFESFVNHQQDFLPEPRLLIIRNNSVYLGGYEGENDFAYSSDAIEDGATYEVTHYNPGR